jgi:hypothetical protein
MYINFKIYNPTYITIFNTTGMSLLKITNNLSSRQRIIFIYAIWYVNKRMQHFVFIHNVNITHFNTPIAHKTN